MARILTSNRSEAKRRVASAVCIGIACGACASGGIETATELPRSPRRPDGVVLDPPPALPSARERAPAVGVVGLREPLADREIEEIVRAYLHHFEREDIDALAQLLTDDASLLGRASGKAQLVDLWRTKMRNFDYRSLAGSEIARLGEIERYAYDALGREGVPARPSEMHLRDIYVRVPIATPRVGGEQLFGDVLVLLLRREGGRLKIAGQTDEVNP